VRFGEISLKRIAALIAHNKQGATNVEHHQHSLSRILLSAVDRDAAIRANPLRRSGHETTGACQGDYFGGAGDCGVCLGDNRTGATSGDADACSGLVEMTVAAAGRARGEPR
jgi:hypothetical protein